MTPSTAPGRTAEELREALITHIIGHHVLNRWQSEAQADALLKGPLAQLKADLRAAREERDRLQTSLEECAALVGEYATAAAPEGIEVLAKDRDKWFDAASVAKAEAASLRSRRKSLEEALIAVRDRIIEPIFGGIDDTFWMTDRETVVDFINVALIPPEQGKLALLNQEESR